MTEMEHEVDWTSGTRMDDGEFNEAFVAELQCWRRHADIRQKRDDMQLIEIFVDLGQEMVSIHERRHPCGSS